VRSLKARLDNAAQSRPLGCAADESEDPVDASGQGRQRVGSAGHRHSQVEHAVGAVVDPEHQAERNQAIPVAVDERNRKRLLGRIEGTRQEAISSAASDPPDVCHRDGVAV
jgi:hypothetical protein